MGQKQIPACGRRGLTAVSAIRSRVRDDRKKMLLKRKSRGNAKPVRREAAATMFRAVHAGRSKQRPYERQRQMSSAMNGAGLPFVPQGKKAAATRR